MLKVGIIGLPNVGKSTLFNALTRQAAKVSNFPFTTIEPNVGVVPVPDERLQKIADIAGSAQTVPTTIEFVDIAGLVKNAHWGEGLGNQFLSHIREVDAIVHVVRFFKDDNVAHIHDTVDPLNDAAIVETELELADQQTLDKFSKSDKDYDIQLLNKKPTLYIANVDESQIKDAKETTREFGRKYKPVLPLSIKIEQEIIELPDDERSTFLQEYELEQTGLDRLIKASYNLLELITFFTFNKKEARAWTVRKGSLAPQAAGKVHTDMEHGFIRAETVSYDDLVAAGSYADARAAGNIRDEGKEYVVQDGDVILFKFNI